MTQQPANTPPANNGEGGSTQAPAAPDSWDAWLATQPDEQRTTISSLYEKQTAGLKSALDNERQQRKDFEKQARELAKTAEKGSDAEKQLTQFADQLTAAERRADFYEAAAKPEIGLVGVKAAWVLMNAEADRYFDRKGNPNFDLLKQEHPYLFGLAKTTPKGNQGNGTNGQTPAGQSINDMIRNAAGRHNL